MDPNGNWKFLTWDAEKSFGSHNANIVNVMTSAGKYYQSPADLFAKLMKNGTFSK